MEITSGNYTIKADSMCMWIEERYKVDKELSAKRRKAEIDPDMEAEGTRRVAGYCDNMEQLLNDFLERKERTRGAKTIEEYLTEMAKVEKEIKDMIKAVAKWESELRTYRKSTESKRKKKRESTTN